MTFLDALHIEANGGDGAMAKLALGPLPMTAPMVARSSSIGTLMEQCRRRLALLGANDGLLDSEFASLDGIRSAQPRREMWSIWHCHYRIRKRLTARTLKSEVLPAFCSPIMVMSISVALYSENHQHPSLFIVERGFAFSRNGSAGDEVSNGASGTKACADNPRKGKVRGRHTRTSGAASRRCDEISWPW